MSAPTTSTQTCRIQVPEVRVVHVDYVVLGDKARRGFGIRTYAGFGVTVVVVLALTSCHLHRATNAGVETVHMRPSRRPRRSLSRKWAPVAHFGDSDVDLAARADQNVRYQRSTCGLS